jgi:hypothetical protein
MSVSEDGAKAGQLRDDVDESKGGRWPADMTTIMTGNRGRVKSVIHHRRR